MRQLHLLFCLVLLGPFEAIGILDLQHDLKHDIDQRSDPDQALLAWVLRGLQGDYYPVVYRDARLDDTDGLRMGVPMEVATVELQMDAEHVPQVDTDAWDKDSAFQHVYIFLSRDSWLVNKVCRSSMKSCKGHLMF